MHHLQRLLIRDDRRAEVRVPSTMIGLGADGSRVGADKQKLLRRRHLSTVVRMPISLAEIEAVYRTRGADFFRLALARTGDPEAARDAVQEGFADAIRGRWSYGARGSLEAWVARCVINAAHDVTRVAKAIDARTATIATSMSGGVAEPVSCDGDVAALREAVRRLPQRQRHALFLRHYLGFEYAAIAETLGVEVGTVSATLHTARASLAERLQEVAQ